VGVQRVKGDTTQLRHERTLRRTLFCYSLGLSQSAKAPSGDGHSSGRSSTRAAHIERLLMLISHRPGYLAIDPKSLLMGCQGGLDPAAFDDESQHRWPLGTPMRESPHVQLLLQARNAARELSDEEILDSDYWRLVESILDCSGDYFGARDRGDVMAVVRGFLNWSFNGTARLTASGGSAPNDKVLVARATGSQRFHVIDGHHRVAVAILHGDETIRVRQTWLSTGVVLNEDHHDVVPAPHD
jgi:hypothetical protein